MCLSFLQVAWSVARKTPAYTFSPLDPVQFNSVNINVGNTWDAATSAAVISRPGLYYIHVDLGTCYNGGVVFIVKVNGAEKFRAEFIPVTMTSMESRGNAALLQLNNGDIVTVSFISMSRMCLYADTNNVTAFYGMLLTPL